MVNFIQTLYIDKSKDIFNDGFGWSRPEFHLMGWALSSLQLNKLHKKVDIYANSGAAKILIDILGLPYAELHLEHDNLNLVNNRLWALPKIFTYSLQDKPFLHIDGDVFLFDQFSNSLLKSQLIAQNLENATFYYTSTQHELMENFTYFPKCVKVDFDSTIPIKGVNAGILGGNNISFIKEYTNEAFKYINRNVEHLSSINVDRFNVFFEQHLFYSLATERQIPINFLINDIINDNEYEHLGSFHEVPFHKNYLHLLGHFKRDEFTCLQMAAKLRELYPEYYYKIISIFKTKNIPLFHSFYINEKLESISDFQCLHKKAKECYRNGIDKINYRSYDHDTDKLYNELPDLSLLNQIFKTYIDNTDTKLDMVRFNDDFESFFEKLVVVLKVNTQISNYYFYGRDIFSVNWYFELFGCELDIYNKIISQSEEIKIIESEFDWAGMMNKYKRDGIKYYKDLEFQQGHFFNLIVPEVSNNKFSLYDIDELEKLILDHLVQPITVNNLLLEMQAYIEEDIVQNHIESYNNLILGLIKQLVVKKAIKPIY
jgi:hypothetical protein